MKTKTFHVRGRAIERGSRRGLGGLQVEAWDKDLIFDDLVGGTDTDKEGRFELRFDETYFSELFLDRRPDLYFRVYHQGAMLHSTEHDVLWNFASGEQELTIEVDRGLLGLDEDALGRCDRGIRRLLASSDQAIIDAVKADEARLRHALERTRRQAKGSAAASSRAPFATSGLRPHPVLAAAMVDVLRRVIRVRAIVDFAGNADDLRALGITVRSAVHDIFTVTATRSQLATLASQPATRRICTPRQFVPELAQTLAAAQIDTIQDAFLNRGANTAIAMIDGPVDVRHEAFRNSDGTTRMSYLWVQHPMRGAAGQSPADYFAPLFPAPGSNPFSGWADGILYDEAAINRALELGSTLEEVYGIGVGQIATDPAVYTDADGVRRTAFDHGSHTTAIAAGTHVATRRGAAPEAAIINVVPRWSWHDSLGGIGPDAYVEDAYLDGIACALELGNQLGLPTVVNCSFGHNLGAHNGDSLFDRSLDESLHSWSGRSIVIAAGNNNYDGFRKERLSAGATLTDAWELSSWEDKDDLFLDIWSRGGALAVKADVGTASTGWLPAESATEFNEDLDAGAQSYPLDISRDAEPMRGMHNIRIHIQGFKAASPWTITLRNDHATEAAELWGWVGLQGRDGTITPHTPDETSINDIACTRSIISVGATNEPIGGTPEETYNFDYAGIVYRPSGCGPTLDGRIKPEIVAVGANVSSARGATRNEYWFMSGTSQSAPVVAGAAALLLSAQPDLTQDAIKSLLINHADTTGIDLDDPVQRNQFGNGRLRMRAIFENITDPGDVDVFVRTADDDYGREPYSGGCFCHAPEVRVQAAEIYDADAPHTTGLRWGHRHALSVRVHNLSATPALDTEVRLYYTRPWTAPADWVPCTSDASGALVRRLDIPPLGHADFVFDASSEPGVDRCWVPRETEVPEVDSDWGDHFCLLVVARHEASGDVPDWDEESAEGLDAWTRNIKGTNNVALRNVHIQ